MWDEEFGPTHGMHGTLDAGFDENRTIKSALTAFLCLLRRIVCPTTAHVDNKGIHRWVWTGEMMCVGQEATDADLWIMIWEELYRLQQEGILLKVARVKAHRSKKEKQHMSRLEQFVTEGWEK